MTNRKRTYSRRKVTVEVPDNAGAILQMLDPQERHIMTLRWGLQNGRPLNQQEVANVVGIHSTTVSRIEKRVREQIADLTPSQLSTLVEAQEIGATSNDHEVQALQHRLQKLIDEVGKMEVRMMREITRVENRLTPADPPAAPKRIGIFRRASK